MASPHFTVGSVGNGLTAAAIAPSGTSTFQIDLSTVFEGQVQLRANASTAPSAVSGIQMDVYPGVGPTPSYDTTPIASQVLGVVNATNKFLTIKLGTGKYSFTLTNLDVTGGHNVTAEVTYSTIDSVA